MAREGQVTGQAYLKDGRLHVHGSASAPALVIPGEGVKLRVNGEEFQEPVEIRPEDHVEIVLPPAREEPGKVQVLITADKLQAWLEVQLGRRLIPFLPDLPPRPRVVLQPQDREEKFFPVSKEELLRLLAEKGVQRGLLLEVIDELYRQPQEGRFLIATGQPPTPPQDEEVEASCCPREVGRPVVTENGRVDYRELQRFPSVAAGCVLGIKKPAVPGQPGWGVDGQPLPPRPPKEAILEAGPGAQLAPDGLSVLATIDGKPVYRQRGNRHYFAVEPLLKIQGNVDMGTGNVKFAGNVKVSGNVAESMEVRAGGSVWVEGEVASALIEARGDVTIGNVIASTVRAGGAVVVYAQLLSSLQEFGALLREAMEATADLQRHAASQKRPLKAGTAFLLLLERKYSRLLQILREISKQVEAAQRQKSELPSPLLSGLQEVQRALNAIRFSPPDQLRELEEGMQQLHLGREELEKYLTGGKARIVIRYALNSVLEATGDILVTGQGAYNSILRAGGKVRVEGILRGGRAEAQEEIAINVAGSDLGVKTVIVAPAPHRIKLKKAYPGVIIQAGKQVTELTTPLREIKVGLSSSGRLEVIGISWAPDQENT
ncbi:DUF342 domain-containing protein [Desulfothermobacter acidiphilus]|uniref:DUF342 domain-containing protein n=1 Tax=Desulfothermobacter acidiphilus TaxID=1938353 RepID=UPI003F8CD4A8